MQTQGELGPLFHPEQSASSCCQSSIKIEQGILCKHDPLDSDRTSHRQATRGAVHTASNVSRIRITPEIPLTGAACIYPDRQMAIQELERMRNQGRMSGIWDGAVKVGRQEGVRGLWRGLTPTL